MRCGLVGGETLLAAYPVNPMQLAGISCHHDAGFSTGMELGKLWGMRGCPVTSSFLQDWRAHPMPCELMPTPGPALLPPLVSPWLSPTATTGTWRSSSTPVVRRDSSLGRLGEAGHHPKASRASPGSLQHGVAPTPPCAPQSPTIPTW